MKPTRWIWAAALAALVIAPGCKGKKNANKTPPKQAQKTAKKTPPPPPKPKPATPQQLAQAVQDCWSAFASKNADKFQSCYDDNATSVVVGAVPAMKATGAAKIVAMTKGYWGAFSDLKAKPKLVLVSGDKAAVIGWESGKNTGKLGGMPATGKTFGMLEGEYLEFNPAGKATQDFEYGDDLTMMAQLGVLKKMPARAAMTKAPAKTEVVIAKNNAAEKANLAVVAAARKAFTAHDTKKLMGMYAKDATFSDQLDPKDAVGKKAIAKSLKKFFAMTKKVKVNSEGSWAAGDYVVVQGSESGTFSGKLPKAMRKAKGKSYTAKDLEIFKVEGGKIKAQYIFANKATIAQQVGLMPAPGKKGAHAGKKHAHAGKKHAHAHHKAHSKKK